MVNIFDTVPDTVADTVEDTVPDTVAVRLQGALETIEKMTSSPSKSIFFGSCGTPF